MSNFLKLERICPPELGSGYVDKKNLTLLPNRVLNNTFDKKQGIKI